MLSLKNVSPNGPIAKMSEVMVDSTSVVLFETVELSGGKQLGLITLNVEKTLNSLSLEMVDLIHPQLARWERDEAIGLVMFQGAGDRAFCAGGDIQNLYHDMAAHPWRDLAPTVRLSLRRGISTRLLSSQLLKANDCLGSWRRYGWRFRHCISL